MDFINSFFQLGDAMGDILSIRTIIIMIISVTLGVFFGALPGLTATMGVALLTGLTFSFAMVDAITILIGIYIGAIYGGSRPAILLNIPGTPASASTTLDGIPLVKKGEAPRALTVATVASFIGTIFGIVLLFLVSPLIVKITLNFGAHEYFILALFGILICGTLTSNDPKKGWISGFLGLLISCIGIEQMQAYPRFTYGNLQLSAGIELIPAMIGIFAIPQIITALKNIDTSKVINHVKSSFRDTWVYILSVFNYWKTCLRAGSIGGLIGAIPGTGGDIACWLAYDAEKRFSKNSEEFGKGKMEGLIAPEVANNSVIGGAFIPMLTLAIPGDAVTAVILGAFFLHGVRPGPMLMFEMPEVFYSVIGLGLIGAVCMLIIGLMITPILIKLLSIPTGQLMPIVGALTVIGAFAINMRLFDVAIMLLFGVIGYFMYLGRFPAAPLILGMILGPLADENLRRALMLSDGSILPFFQKPISLFFIILIAIIVSSGIYRNIKNKRSLTA